MAGQAGSNQVAKSCRPNARRASGSVNGRVFCSAGPPCSNSLRNLWLRSSIDLAACPTTEIGSPAGWPSTNHRPILPGGGSLGSIRSVSIVIGSVLRPGRGGGSAFPRLTRQVSDFQHRAYLMTVIRATRGRPGRSPVRDAQATCVVCAPSKLDDPATRIENQLVKSKWAC